MINIISIIRNCSLLVILDPFFHVLLLLLLLILLLLLLLLFFVWIEIKILIDLEDITRL